MKFRLFFVLLLLASGNGLVAASMFSIQIVASKSPDLTTLKALTGFEELYTEKTKSGLVRVKLGSYPNRVEAMKDLETLQAKGFSDAFIKTEQGYRNVTSESRSSHHHEASEANHTHPEDSPNWTKLTEEQKRNVVYLDGVLHVHENDKFKPLSSF